MRIFLDTSSLFKLYHREEGTTELEQVFSKVKVTSVFLSEISKIEFSSTIWKKVRTKEISELVAQQTLSFFESDFGKYTFITIDSLLIEQANIFISKYGKQGLRTLDSIQLSTAISLHQKADIFFTADRQLQSFFLAEGLSIS